MSNIIKIGQADKFLEDLEYSEGFSANSIIEQVEFGVYGTAEGLNEADAAAAGRRISANAAMPVGAATTMDKVILRAITAQPTLYRDLVTAGCTMREPMGTFISRYAKSNLAQAPSIAMDTNYQGGNYSNQSQSQSDYVDIAVPIPVQWYDWALSRRQIAAANNTTSMFGGLNLQEQEVTVKTTGLLSASESLIWNGNANIKINTTPLYGILTQPEVINAATDLEFSRSQPDLFIEQFLENAIQPLLDKNYDQTNLMVYYSSNLGAVFQSDYLNQFALRTLTTRIMEISGIVGVKATRWLNDPTAPNSRSAGRLVVIKMEPQVIDLAIESEIQVAQYAQSPMKVKYAMFSAFAPRIKVDYYGNCGIQLVNLTVVD